MTYQLGIDLGTTYTAAAVRRGDQVEIVGLGGRAAAVPSVLLLREDETVLVGEAATRRAMTEPERVAREFKRRLGDPTPLLLGTTPYSAEALTAKVLRWVIDQVTELEGGPPDQITVTHPANWGPYKQDLLSQALRMAELGEVTTITEPEAAAIAYADNERVEPGSLLAVYDLGGGTFDAAVLRKTEGGFEILGQPEGIERLGGIDFDEAVFAHVNQALDGALDDMDTAEPTALAALARLRQECVEAKEALSADTDVSIPVLLPGLQTEVRLTRVEFEAMVRPTLAETIGALRRALTNAGVAPEQVDAVLLVGGSSRIPLISQLVSAELGRPVAVDAHPKHAIATGAALFTRASGGTASDPGISAAPILPLSAAALSTGPEDAPAGQGTDELFQEPESAHEEPSLPEASSRQPPTTEPLQTQPTAAEPSSEPTQGLAPPTEQVDLEDADDEARKSRRLLPLVAGALALALIGGGTAFALLVGDDSDDADLVADDREASPEDADAEEPGEEARADEPGDEAEAEAAEHEEADRAAPAEPDEAEAPDVGDGPDPDEADPEERAADDEQADPGDDRTHEVPPDTDYALITDISLEDAEGGSRYAVEFESFEFDPEVPGQHVHFFFDTVPADEAGVPGDGPWILYGGDSPFTEYAPADRPGGAEEMCVLVANEDHSVQADTGNCHALPDNGAG